MLQDGVGGIADFKPLDVRIAARRISHGLNGPDVVPDFVEGAGNASDPVLMVVEVPGCAAPTGFERIAGETEIGVGLVMIALVCVLPSVVTSKRSMVLAMFSSMPKTALVISNPVRLVVG